MQSEPLSATIHCMGIINETSMLCFPELMQHHDSPNIILRNTWINIFFHPHLVELGHDARTPRSPRRLTIQSSTATSLNSSDNFPVGSYADGSAESRRPSGYDIRPSSSNIINSLAVNSPNNERSLLPEDSAWTLDGAGGVKRLFNTRSN